VKADSVDPQTLTVCSHSSALACTNIVSDTEITLFKDSQVTYIPRELHDFSKAIDPETCGIISKCSSVGRSYISIESKMLRECGGMFGVMTYYHSSVVCHKEVLPTTNHLFLKDAKFWHFFTSKSDYSPDFRILIQQFSQFAGHSLVTVSSAKDLFVAIVHAALGKCQSD
jgi:hypothetical protein